MIKVVLVRPIYPRNIGMCARAIANFGNYSLILIDPQCELNIEAREGAARAQEPLQNATIYETWDQFYEREPEGLRVAFSRRNGRNRVSYDFSQTLEQEENFIAPDEDASDPTWTYLIFGPEDHGLAESDLDYVHRIMHFNMPGKVKSLNLSHAVLNALSLVNEHRGDIDMEQELYEEPFFFPDQTLRRWLETLNIDITTRHRVNAYTVLKKLLLNGVPSPKELRILEIVMQQTIRKLKNSKGNNQDRKEVQPLLPPH